MMASVQHGSGRWLHDQCSRQQGQGAWGQACAAGQRGDLFGPQWPGSCDTGAQKSWQEGLLTVTKELPTQGVKFSMTWEVAGWHGLS